MAFPKKKSRKITIANKEYCWLCTKEVTLDTPVDVKPNASFELPPLAQNIEWCWYEDVYGYNSKTILLILDETTNIKIRFELNGQDYFQPSLKKVEIRFIPITPALVKKCIEYLNEYKQWIKQGSITDTFKLFGKEIRTLLTP